MTTSKWSLNKFSVGCNNNTRSLRSGWKCANLQGTNNSIRVHILCRLFYEEQFTVRRFYYLVFNETFNWKYFMLTYSFGNCSCWQCVIYYRECGERDEFWDDGNNYIGPFGQPCCQIIFWEVKAGNLNFVKSKTLRLARHKVNTFR